MRLILFILLIFTKTLVIKSFAQDQLPDLQHFRVNKINISLIHDPKLHLLVSRNCLLQTGENWEPNQKCLAIQKLKIASLKTLGTGLLGGANPGAVACLKLGGKIFIALDSHKNQNSVCQFSDSSIVSTGTLHYHAMENDTKNL